MKLNRTLALASLMLMPSLWATTVPAGETLVKPGLELAEADFKRKVLEPMGVCVAESGQTLLSAIAKRNVIVKICDKARFSDSMDCDFDDSSRIVWYFRPYPGTLVGDQGYFELLYHRPGKTVELVGKPFPFVSWRQAWRSDVDPLGNVINTTSYYTDFKITVPAHPSDDVVMKNINGNATRYSVDMGPFYQCLKNRIAQ